MFRSNIEKKKKQPQKESLKIYSQSLTMNSHLCHNLCQCNHLNSYNFSLILWEDVWSRWTLDYTLALILPCVVGPRMQSGRMKQTGMLSNVIVHWGQVDLIQAHAHMHTHLHAHTHTPL